MSQISNLSDEPAVDELGDSFHESFDQAINLREAFETGEYSDLTIHCGGRDFNVHKLIVCGKSKYLDNLIKSNFERDGKTYVKIPGIDALVVNSMLRHLYGLIWEVPEMRQDFEYLASVYVAADLLQLPALKKEAMTRFRDGSSSDVESARQVLLEAPEVLQQVPQGDKFFRNAILDVVADYAREAVTNCKQQRKLFNEHPDLAFDLLLKIKDRAITFGPAGDLPISVDRECRNCGDVLKIFHVGKGDKLGLWELMSQIECAETSCGSGCYGKENFEVVLRKRSEMPEEQEPDDESV